MKPWSDWESRDQQAIAGAAILIAIMLVFAVAFLFAQQAQVAHLRQLTVVTEAVLGLGFLFVWVRWQGWPDLARGLHAETGADRITYLPLLFVVSWILGVIWLLVTSYIRR